MVILKTSLRQERWSILGTLIKNIKRHKSVSILDQSSIKKVISGSVCADVVKPIVLVIRSESRATNDKESETNTYIRHR